MGNELSACACGNKKDVDEEKKPLNRPQPKEKPKKKAKLFSKRRKKNYAENEVETEQVFSNPNVKKVIHVDVERSAEWRLSDKSRDFPPRPFNGIIEESEIQEASISPSTAERRTLFPTSPPSTPYIKNAPLKPRRLYAHQKSALLPQNGKTTKLARLPVVKFSDDGDINLGDPRITIHESLTEIPPKAKQLFSSQDKHVVADEATKTRIQSVMGRHDGWGSATAAIREQYDIIFIADDRDAAVDNVQEIIILVQKELQKVYVLVDPRFLSEQSKALIGC